MIVPINAIDVLIGGESVGIILNYDGVCITGFYKIKVDNEIIDPSNYFEINDIITSVDKKNVKTIHDLSVLYILQVPHWPFLICPMQPRRTI